VRDFDYARPADLAEARALLREDGARPLAGGTDLLPAQDHGIWPARRLVDVRALGLGGIAERDGALVVGATTTVADVARDERVRERYAALSEAARSAASPQLREMGTVGGNLCQAVRCWYFRHPDLRCWLRGGDTCYAQIGDHRRHALEPGDCISVAPSDLSAALAALDAEVVTSERRMPLLELYRRPSEVDRSRIALEPGEIVLAVVLPRPPDASAYARAGERAAWSFANAAVAAARFGDDVRLAAIGVANVVRPLDPADPLAGLPGLPLSSWKRRLLEGLVAEALEGVRV
jgi:xanthine dehydrogenase YagS FAD-binding subunit